MATRSAKARSARSALFLIATTTVMASAAGTFSSISEASCAGPMVKTPKTAEPGEVISVRGMYWAAECNDTESCTVGCGGESCSGGEKSPPETDLEITLVLEKQPGTLAGVPLVEGIDADPKNFRVLTEVTLPEDLDPGRYQIAMGNEHTGMYRSNVIVVE